MELNFSEADLNKSYQKSDYNNYERQTNVNSEKYWEKTPGNKQNASTPSKKKKVSFDDILSNMNLVVNKSGVLQFMTPNQEQPTTLQQQYSPQQYPSVQQQEPKSILIKKEPLDTSVKHSYIYNKYFKDYQDSAPVTREIKVPKTKQEYLKMLIEERIRQNMERKRISQIKSTKLLFTTNVGNQGVVKASNNTLGKLNFR